MANTLKGYELVNITDAEDRKNSIHIFLRRETGASIKARAAAPTSKPCYSFKNIYAELNEVAEVASIIKEMGIVNPQKWKQYIGRLFTIVAESNEALMSSTTWGPIKCICEENLAEGGFMSQLSSDPLFDIGPYYRKEAKKKCHLCYDLKSDLNKGHYSIENSEGIVETYCDCLTSCTFARTIPILKEARYQSAICHTPSKLIEISPEKSLSYYDIDSIVSLAYGSALNRVLYISLLVTSFAKLDIKSIKFVKAQDIMDVIMGDGKNKDTYIEALKECPILIIDFDLRGNFKAAQNYIIPLIDDRSIRKVYNEEKEIGNKMTHIHVHEADPVLSTFKQNQVFKAIKIVNSNDI